MLDIKKCVHRTIVILFMPIANCIISSDCIEGSGNLVELWSSESDISSEHMTINIIASSKQIGNKYRVMANLYLPSMWSDQNITELQVGLARALAQYFTLALSEVHVVTSIVKSGLVVESGENSTW